MEIIDGKKLANEIKDEIKNEVDLIKENNQKIPHLAAVLVGSDGASETYVNHKEKACAKVGFKSTVLRFDSDITENQLLKEVDKLNNNQEIDGFIVQLPLPSHIDDQKIIMAIDPEKDVDGFHPVNVGKLSLGLPTYVSATPFGIMEMIKRYNIETSGKHVVVLGRSNIVGKPVSSLFAQKDYPGNSTVTQCHSRTKNLPEITRQADIIVVALGRKKFLTSDMVKDGVVVIDVGITRVKSDKTKSGWKLLGDVDFDDVAPKSSYITPVPGGVGPMTIVGLLKNTIKASKQH